MKKFKVFKASFYYLGALNYFYERNIIPDSAPYETHYQQLMDFSFLWSDWWKKHLEATEKFECTEVVINNPLLQKKWAIQNGIEYNSDWMISILIEQVRKIQPDIFFTHELRHIDSSVIDKIKEAAPSIKYVIGYDGIAQCDTEYFKRYDLVLSCGQFVTDYYKKHGVNSLFLPHAFEDSLLQKLNFNKKYNSVFTGSMVLFKGGHFSRMRLIAEVIKKCDTEIWVSELYQNYRSIGRAIINLSPLDYWKLMRIALRNNGPAFGLEMYQILANSKITLNTHIDKFSQTAANIRLFEATGVGSMLLTDYKPNIEEYFEIDKEIVVYNSTEECIDKIKYYSKHDSSREKIAIAGQHRTLQNFTYKQSIGKLTNHLIKTFG